MSVNDDDYAADREQQEERWDAEITELYEKEARRLVGFLERRTDSTSFVEDIVQDAFLIMRRKWPEVRDRNPKAFLYQVARHLLYRRWRNGCHEVFLGDQYSFGVTESFDDHDARLDVRAAVAKLSARQREATFLYYFYGFSQEEITAIMQIRPGTVKALLYQARARLAILLNDQTGKDGL